LLSSLCGTPNYIAPEILNKSGHSFEVDIWALGVIVYSLIIGKPPFETADVKTTYDRIAHVQYTFPVHLQIPTLTHAL
jgi:polo-like kinase 1